MKIRACTLKNIDRRVFCLVFVSYIGFVKNHQKNRSFLPKRHLQREVIKSRLAGRRFRVLDKDPLESKVLERYFESIASEIKTEKNSRVIEVVSDYLNLSSEKKVKSKLFFCTFAIQDMCKER